MRSSDYIWQCISIFKWINTRFYVCLTNCLWESLNQFCRQNSRSKLERTSYKFIYICIFIMWTIKWHDEASFIDRHTLHVSEELCQNWLHFSDVLFPLQLTTFTRSRRERWKKRGKREGKEKIERRLKRRKRGWQREIVRSRQIIGEKERERKRGKWNLRDRKERKS